MSLATYGELQEAVNSALARSDIPSYVYSLATRELNNRLRLRDMETTATLTPSGATVTLPADFAMIRHAYLDVEPRIPLDVASGFGESAWHDTSGRPREYVVTGSTLTLNPIPDDTYSVVVRYVAELAEFSASEDTNAVLTRFPGLYLYAVLKHAAVWLQDMQLAGVYAQALESEIDRVQKEDRAARYPSPLRVRVVR